MAAYASGSSWSFPEDLPGGWVKVEDESKTSETPTTSSESEQATPQPTPTSQPTSEHTPPEPTPQPQPTQNQNRRRTHYPPRQCRICLDIVHPTFKTLDPTSTTPPTGLSASLPPAFQPSPHVVYESPPGDGGRLLRPCKCKGSQKYVHEECLRAWRLQDPLQKRNYWQCPTCQYKYQLRRLTWGSWISSTVAQVGLTIMIFVTAMFVLGFIADPIINLYVDPVGTIFSGLSADDDDYYDKRIFPVDDEPSGWAEHFIKGLASLGLLGFAKFLFTISPFHWFNYRGGGGIYVGGGGGRGNTGRDRLNQLSWVAIVVGIATFLFAVWKGVRAWSRRTLEKAGERVMDVPADLGGDDDEDEDTRI